MGEYSNIIKTKELKTLEIDIDKNIFKLNGDDIKRCLKLDIEIDAHKREVCLLADTTVKFEGRKRRGGKTMKCVFCGRIHRAWRRGMSIGGICPRCWAKLYRAQIKERGLVKWI